MLFSIFFTIRIYAAVINAITRVLCYGYLNFLLREKSYFVTEYKQVEYEQAIAKPYFFNHPNEYHCSSISIS